MAKTYKEGGNPVISVWKEIVMSKVRALTDCFKTKIAVYIVLNMLSPVQRP